MLGRLARVIGVTVLSVVVLYYVGLNALLLTPLPEYLLNSSPRFAQIHFARAWTSWVPMRFEVQGLRISIQDRLVQVAVTADTARGDLRPWALKDLRFVANHLEGEGVTFRLRPRMSEDDPRMAVLDELAPIEGFETPVRDQVALEVQIGEAKMLTVEFGDLKVHHLRELWIDQIRYTGDAEVSGGLMYAPFQKLRFDQVRFSDANSKLVAVEPHVATFEALAFEVALPEVNLNSFQLATLAHLDAHLHLVGNTEPGFLNVYLKNLVGVPGLALRGDEGRVEVDATVVSGQLLDGGRLVYRAHAGVRFPWFTAAGDVEVAGVTEKSRLLLGVDVDDALLRRGTLSARATRVRLEASSDSDLTKEPQIDAVLSLTNARVSDLRALDSLLPPGAGVHFAFGHGRIDGRVQIDAAPARARGEVTLEADDVVLKNYAATIEGKLSLHARLQAFDFASDAIDLSGSTLDIDDALVHAGPATWKQLWLHVRLPRCHFAPNGPRFWSASLEVGATNLQPLYALLAANAPLPKALGLLLNSPNPRFTTDLEVRADGVKLGGLLLTSQNIRVEGGLLLKPRPSEPTRLEPWGRLVVHVTPFVLGLQLAGERASLIDPVHALD